MISIFNQSCSSQQYMEEQAGSLRKKISFFNYWMKPKFGLSDSLESEVVFGNLNLSIA